MNLSMLSSMEEADQLEHECTLNRGSQSHLPRLPLNASFWARLKRRLQKILIVSSKHPSTRLYLHSKAAIVFEKRRHGISSSWWVIHPCSSFRFVWDCAMAVAYLYMFIMIPYMMSFHRISKKGINVINASLVVLNPGYYMSLINMCLNFITGYISPDGHEIHIAPTLILQHYLLGYFTIDFVSAVPYTWFHMEMLEKPGPDSKLHLLVLEMLTLLKLCRLTTAQKYIKQMIMYCGGSRITEHIVWIFLMTIMNFHWAACITYIFPFIYAYITRTPIKDAEGFVFNTDLYKRSDVHIYLTSLYMGGGNLCSYSFTEFSFADFPDKVTRSVLLLYGMGYFLYVIVLVLQLVDSASEPELKYQLIMQGVKDYIIKKKLPIELKERLLHFYEHRFQGSLFKEHSITSTLSNHLKHEIIHHNSLTTLSSIPLFYNIHRSLIKKIIGALKQVMFLPGDIIFKCDDEAKYMYFIVSGTVALVTRAGKEERHAKDGDFFGEIALIKHRHKRLRTAIAVEVCEILRLNGRDFQRLIPIKSELYSRLVESMEQLQSSGSNRPSQRESTIHVYFDKRKDEHENYEDENYEYENEEDENEEDENEEDENEEDENEEDENEEDESGEDENEEDENDNDQADDNDDDNYEDHSYNGNGYNENINNVIDDSVNHYSINDFDGLLNTAV